MRNAFINTLCELAENNDDVFLICGDLGYSVLEPFAERFPDRYLNAGIAEQNMTGVAVGLAREGYNVFTYSIGNFPTLRCMEQIRYDVCYHEANVKIVAVGAGYAYGSQGASHHTTEDISMMRAIPGMSIAVPSDAKEAVAVAEYMVKRVGPGYIRLNKTGEPLVHDSDDVLKLTPGKFLPVKEGIDVLVLATGPILHQIYSELKLYKKNWALWSAPFIGGYDAADLKYAAENFSLIVTVEEHQLRGGFGSSILEVFGDLYAGDVIPKMPKIKRIGIPDIFIGTAGNQEYLRRAAGLTITNLFD